MSRYIVFCVLTAFLTALLLKDVESLFIFDFNPEQQADFQPYDANGWKSIFGVADAPKVENTYKVENLFFSSKLTVVPSGSGQVENFVRYTIGKRVSKDRVVAHGEDYGKWNTPVNKTLTLKYPSSGQGAKVTCADFIVRQTSNIRRLQVISGGIGQRSIAIILVANETLHFAYKGDIYGI